MQFLQAFGSIDWPQLLQNFAPACTCAWQFGQVTVAAAVCGCVFAPQFWQNFALAGFAVPHFGQGVACADAPPPDYCPPCCPCCCP